MMLLGIGAGVFTGLLLGLLGSGGSIITLPVFLYLLFVPTKPAIAMTLASVGMTAAVSAVDHWRRGNVDLGVGATFAVFAAVGAFLGAKIGLMTPAIVQLLLFAGFMYVAAWRMLRPSAPAPAPATLSAAAAPSAAASAAAKGGYDWIWKIGVSAFLVGVITGIVGIGGGFLIIPALVLVVGLPMKKAVGTSLMAIAVKSAAGFAGYVGSVAIDYTLLWEFTVVAIAGSFIGAALSKQMSAETLKKVFAWFVLVVATYIVLQQGLVLWRK